MNTLTEEEMPWEIIPRYVEYPYEAVPVLEDDVSGYYGVKKLGMGGRAKRPRDIAMELERRERAMWEERGGKGQY